MFNRYKSLGIFCILFLFVYLLFIPEEAGAVGGSEEHIYYYNEIVNTGLDNGYSGNDTIKKDDPHYGWSLGRFSIKGYSAKKETDGNLVFLKNVKNNNENDNEGNKVSLYFTLEQDIDKLNGKDNTKISDDENGYDEHIGTAQNKFGRGTLIVTHTDYTNTKRDPEIHTNFLKVKAAKGKEQLIDFCEEGDYEVVLDYEIVVEDKFVVIPTSSYYNYRMSFKFSVRNGNCMVYLMDGKTKSELKNTSITENGFYIDLARSRYLDVNIKRKTLVDGSDVLTEDVRFNGPAEENKIYDKEGIYEITVQNKYTGEKTEKKIYVGKDKILKAYVQNNGMSIKDIKTKVSNGAVISNEGEITMPVATSSVQKPQQSSQQLSVPGASMNEDEIVSDSSDASKGSGEKKNSSNLVITVNSEIIKNIIIIAAAVLSVATVVAVIILVVMRKKKKKGNVIKKNTSVNGRDRS